MKDVFQYDDQFRELGLIEDAVSIDSFIKDIKETAPAFVTSFAHWLFEKHLTHLVQAVSWIDDIHLSGRGEPRNIVGNNDPSEDRRVFTLSQLRLYLSLRWQQIDWQRNNVGS